MARLLGRKAEPGVVVLVPKDDRNSLPTSAKLNQAMPDQVTANLPPLMAGKHGYRSKRNGWHRSLRSFNGDSTEQNMAYDLSVEFGHQRKKNDALFAQPVNQIGFIGTPKSSLIHFPNFGAIPQLLVPDMKIQLRRHRHSCVSHADYFHMRYPSNSV